MFYCAILTLLKWRLASWKDRVFFGSAKLQTSVGKYVNIWPVSAIPAIIFSVWIEKLYLILFQKPLSALLVKKKFGGTSWTAWSNKSVDKIHLRQIFNWDTSTRPLTLNMWDQLWQTQTNNFSFQTFIIIINLLGEEYLCPKGRHGQRLYCCCLESAGFPRP